MNYPKSKRILKEIKRAKKILVNCHLSPDADSVGCALSMFQVLKILGKKIKVVSPSNVSESFDFLPYIEEIQKINFKKFNFENFDLFLALDTPSPDYLTGSSKTAMPKIPIIVIDHHKTNPNYGKINLIDQKIASAAELLYLVFEDWKVELDKNIATTLLTGIIGDTNVFRYPSVTAQTLNISKYLMELGADKNDIIFNIFSSVDINRLKFWGEILAKLNMEKDDNFAWSSVPYKIYEKYKSPESGRESASSNFGQIINETDFSIFMIEEQKNTLSVGLRSRVNFDVSKIASELGGGGHKAAAGAKVEGVEFDEAVKKVLQVARKYARKNSKLKS